MAPLCRSPALRRPARPDERSQPHRRFRWPCYLILHNILPRDTPKTEGNGGNAHQTRTSPNPSSLCSSSQGKQYNEGPCRCFSLERRGNEDQQLIYHKDILQDNYYRTTRIRCLLRLLVARRRIRTRTRSRSSRRRTRSCTLSSRWRTILHSSTSTRTPARSPFDVECRVWRER